MTNQGLPECQNDGPSGLVFGGEEVPLDTYPWFVRLQGDDCLCGGTLISRQYVLTAANCLECIGVDDAAQIGAFMMDINNGGQDNQTLTIKEVVPHPDYNRDLSFNFALLKLESPALATPVRIDGDDGEDVVAGYDDDKTGLFAIGFGTTSQVGDISDADLLLHADVNFVPWDTCNEYFNCLPGNDDSVTEEMMCAGDGTTGDSCWGDIGGPLWDRDAARQVGVMSWLGGCPWANYGLPAGYARISMVVRRRPLLRSAPRPLRSATSTHPCPSRS